MPTKCMQLIVPIVLSQLSIVQHALAGPTNFQELRFPNSMFTEALGVEGKISVGAYWMAIGEPTRGFRHDGENWESIDYPGATTTSVVAIKDNTIAGNYTDTLGTPHFFLRDGDSWRSFDYPESYTNPAVTDFDGRTFIGVYMSSDFRETYGFQFDGEQWTTIAKPGSANSWPFGVEGNVIVGRDGATAYRYDGQEFESLALPTEFMALESEALGVDAQHIVGSYRHGQQRSGFLLSGDTWVSFDYPGALSTIPYDVFGETIVGSIGVRGPGGRGIRTYGFRATVPEPGLSISGLLSMLIFVLPRSRCTNRLS